MLGREPGEFTIDGSANLVENWIDLIHPEDRDGAAKQFNDYLAGGSVGMYENSFRMKHRSGGWVWIWSRGQTLRDRNGNLTDRTVGTHIDITERRKAEQQIEHLSFHDSLTGLYNRRFFDEELKRLDVPRNLPLTLMMVDVNGLKLTNDAFGHAAGDRLLRSVADELRKTFRQDDIIARIGGDEFAILLPKTDEEQARRLKERLISRLSENTVEELPLSVACGWAIKTDSSGDMSKAFGEAEDHMYQEKAAEKSSYRYRTTQLIMQTLYAKSPRERQHAERVSQLCGQIGTTVGLTQTEIDQLLTAGELHDIGKISIDNEILDKNGSLNESEWEQIKRHPRVGESILGAVNDYGPLAEWVLSHHERWDGTGYPNGLKGTDIPKMARIIAVADAYDAMISERPYRKAMSKEEAVAELEACAGSQFDPEVVKVFAGVLHGIDRDSQPPGGHRQRAVGRRSEETH